MSAAVSIDQVAVGYGSTPVQSGIDVRIPQGEIFAVVGDSGSGKSTLLRTVIGLMPAQSGEILFGGATLEERMRHGRPPFGVLFQNGALWSSMTTLENVMLPMDFSCAFPARERQARALELLTRVGVPEQADKLPSTLSGGQQQRVAIARALANDPPLIVADEPTGNLDSATGAEIFRLFARLTAEGRTIVVVTHERDTVTGAARTVTLADGCVA